MSEKERIIQDMIPIVGSRYAILVADYIVARDEKKYGKSIRLELLKEMPEYKHINIDEQYEKARRWFYSKGKTLTPRYFVDWLNRLEKPLEGKKVEREAF